MSKGDLRDTTHCGQGTAVGLSPDGSENTPGEAGVILVFALAVALQAPAPPAASARDDRTAFCWAAITNAAVRTELRTERRPEGELGAALNFINGKIRGRYPDEVQLEAAMRAGYEAFGRADIEQAAETCLREIREEMSQYTPPESS
jgi:hypothetical protein